MSLPKTYRQLEYIEFTGTQWIDTGVTGGSNEDYEIEFNLLSNKPTSYTYLGRIISYWYDSWEIQAFQQLNSGDLYYEGIPTGGSASTQVNVLTTDSNKHVLNFTGGTLKVDNVTKGTYVRHGWGSTNVTIGARCTDHNRLLKGRIYTYKMSTNGDLIRDYVSAQRKSDNVLGLYDLVNDVFYTNDGTGTFTAGPVTDENEYELPVTFRELEYLESTGTQYIDVGIKGNLETSFIAKVNKTVRSTVNALAFFGDNTTSSSAISLNLSTSDNKTIRFDGKTISNSAWVSLNTDYVVEINKTGVVIDNVTKGTFTSPSSFTTTNNLYLFIVNGIGSDFIDGTTRIYWAKVFDNNVQVRHYISVQRKSDSVLGLYDLENGVFYTNDGTGTFIAGPVTDENEPVLPSTFKRLAYIESTGHQWINTGIPAQDNTHANKMKIEVDAAFTSLNDSYQRLVDCYLNNGIQIQYYPPTSSTLNVEYGQRVSIQADTNRHTFILDQPNGIASIDSVSGSISSVSTRHDEFLTLFASKSATLSYVYRTHAKMYSCKIWFNGELIRDFVPAQRLSDDIPGLYDLVNDVFYPSDSDTDFIAGTYYNKVIYDGNVLIDLTGDTVTAATLASGSIAHAADGSSITGTMIEATPIDIDTNAGMIAVLIEDNIGKCYRFTGTTDSDFTNGDLYVVEEDI